MRYVISYLIENDNTERLRGFPDAGAGRGFVERMASRFDALHERGATRMFVALARLYEITPLGLFHEVARFDGYASDALDGCRPGWSEL